MMVATMSKMVGSTPHSAQSLQVACRRYLPQRPHIDVRCC